MRLDLKAQDLVQNISDRFPMSSEGRLRAESVLEDALGEVLLEERARCHDIVVRHLGRLRNLAERHPQHSWGIENAVNHLLEAGHDIQGDE